MGLDGGPLAGGAETAGVAGVEWPGCYQLFIAPLNRRKLVMLMWAQTLQCIVFHHKLGTD